jgi:hypothetical protein
MAAEEDEFSTAFRRLGEEAARCDGAPDECLDDVLAAAYEALREVNDGGDNRPAALAFAIAKLAHYGREEAEHVQPLILHAIGVLARIGNDICTEISADKRRAA